MSGTVNPSLGLVPNENERIDEGTTKFHQIPLCLLAAGRDQVEKLNMIVAYLTITTGKRMRTKESADAILMTAGPENPEDWEPYTNEDHPEYELHAVWTLGTEVMSLRWKEAKPCLAWYEKAEEFIAASTPAGKGVTCGRLPKHKGCDDVLYQVYRNKIKWLDFIHWLAVVAIIGSKGWCRITRGRIRSAVMGYPQRIFEDDSEGKPTPEGEALIAQRKDGWNGPSIGKTRAAIKRLSGRFFVTANVSARETYYGRCMSQQELLERVIEQKSEAIQAMPATESRAFVKKKLQTRLEEMGRKLRPTPPLPPSPSTTSEPEASESPACVWPEPLDVVQPTDNDAIPANMEPTLSKPKLEDVAGLAVTEFFAHDESACRNFAARWHNDYGTREEWVTRDWRSAFRAAFQSFLAADRPTKTTYRIPTWKEVVRYGRLQSSRGADLANGWIFLHLGDEEREARWTKENWQQHFDRCDKQALLEAYAESQRDYPLTDSPPSSELITPEFNPPGQCEQREVSQ